MNRQQMAEDVAEACADAFLTACSMVLIQRVDVPPDVKEVLDVAGQMMARVLQRTEAEGAKAR